MIMDGPDYACAFEQYHIAEESYGMTDEQFATFMRALLVSKDGYVCDTGNNETVNFAIADKLISKVTKHPIRWTRFIVG